MDKIFTELEWDDDGSGGAGATNFSFVKTKVSDFSFIFAILNSYSKFC